MGLAIHLLGVPRVERDGKVVPQPRGLKVWGLLAYLVRSARATRPSRRQLAALLFEDADDPSAALRWNLSQLRRLLGDAGLRGELLALSIEPRSYVDVDVVASGTWVEALSAPGLGHELLEGMNFASSPSFEVWLATERRHLQATTEAVLREAALARLSAGAAGEAADLAGRLVRQNPLDENYQALLVRSLAAAGDGVGASRQVAACRELFRRELGVVPGATLDAAMRTDTAAPTARPATGRAAAIAQMEAGEAAIGAGVLDAGLQCLRRAIVEADATGDAALRARARVALGGALVHAARGRDEEGATALHEALTFGQQASPAHAAAACRELGYVEFLRGRYDRALAWLRRAATLAGTDRAEQARIAIVHGSVLSDTAHYAVALGLLHNASHWPTPSAMRSSWLTRNRCSVAHCSCAATCRPRPRCSIDRSQRQTKAGLPSYPGLSRSAPKSICWKATSTLPPTASSMRSPWDASSATRAGKASPAAGLGASPSRAARQRAPSRS
jgi:DNA-binding SARP family transcriptional activator